LAVKKKKLDSYSIGHHDFIYDDPLGTYRLDDIFFPEESEKMPKVPNDGSNQIWVSPKDILLKTGSQFSLSISIHLDTFLYKTNVKESFFQLKSFSVEALIFATPS
jgi:hypothetical protein